MLKQDRDNLPEREDLVACLEVLIRRIRGIDNVIRADQVLSINAVIHLGRCIQLYDEPDTEERRLAFRTFELLIGRPIAVWAAEQCRTVH